MGEKLHVAEALIGDAHAPAGPVAITIADGIIADLRPAPAEGAARLLAMAAPVNAHDHARPLSSTALGLSGKPLETWILGLGLLPAVDAELAATAALARAARGGVAGAMVHMTRAMGLVPLPEEVAQIARAAGRIGIRVALAIGLSDRNPLVYGDHGPVLRAMAAIDAAAARAIAARLDAPRPGIAEQLALVDAAAEAVGDRVDLQYGPTGVQWCSTPLLAAVAEASARTGRRVHMHLLETRAQRDWADRTLPGGIVRHLADIGLLSPRLTLAHCTWARPDELELIAEAGATVVVNSSSNLVLRSGIAPVAAMLKAGVRVAMGVDGAALDDDDDALREMRLLATLHAGRGFDQGLTPAAALTAVCETGRDAIGAPPGGRIAVGQPADLALLDLESLAGDALRPLDVRGPLLARARKEHLVRLIVAGQTVVEDGRLTGADLAAVSAALHAALRAALPDTDVFAAAWGALEPAVVRFYRERLGCC